MKVISAMLSLLTLLILLPATLAFGDVNVNQGGRVSPHHNVMGLIVIAAQQRTRM